MATLEMCSKDESTRNAALLRYTCGHDGRCFGLFHVVVMGHHGVGDLNSLIRLRSKVR